MYSYPKRQNTLYAAFKFGQVLISSLPASQRFGLNLNLKLKLPTWYLEHDKGLPLKKNSPPAG